MSNSSTSKNTRAASEDREARGGRMGQISYMRDPGVEHTYEVSDKVEVYCDHEIDNDRTRGWLKGIIVQIDNKLVAVQFQSNVFLTDGWMVPDRILWYPINSKHIRPVPGRKSKKRERDIPDY